jgi:hypothetical protein
MEMLSESPDEPLGGERPTAEWWYKRPGVVYFFAAGDPPAAIKIGMTTVRTEKDQVQDADWCACILHRHKQIQSANHETIKLLGVIRFSDGEQPTRDAEKHERELHKRFAALQRFKPYTCGAEWFRPGNKLLDYIEANAEKLAEYPGVIGLPINR